MKKILAVLLAAMMLLSLAACGGNEDKTPSGNNDTPPSNSQQQEQNTPAPEDEGDDEDGNENESFVGKYDFAKDYMIPAAGSYQGYTEQKYMDGTVKSISFDVAEITEQEMNDYTATLEANGYEFDGDEGDDFATTGKTYKNDSEGISIMIAYMKMDDDYRISIEPFEVAN